MRVGSDANFGAALGRVVWSARAETHELRRSRFIKERRNGRCRQNKTLSGKEDERGIAAMLMVGSAVRMLMIAGAMRVVRGGIALLVVRSLLGMVVVA